MKKKLLAILTAFIISMSSVPAYAHSGRTDSAGGHHDYNNVSGLGSYHYHHGYGPHLHPNGVCPYESASSTQTSNKPNTTSSTLVTKFNTPTTTTTSKPATTTKPATSTANNSLSNIAVSKNTVVVYVNGKRVSADNFVYNGTTYVPIRAVGDSLGATVNFDAIAKTATITVPQNTQVVTQTVTQPVEDVQMSNYLIATAYASNMTQTIFYIMDSLDPAIYENSNSGTSMLSAGINALKQYVDFIYDYKVYNLYSVAAQASSVIENAEECLYILEHRNAANDSQYSKYRSNVVDYAFKSLSEISNLNGNAISYLASK